MFRNVSLARKFIAVFLGLAVFSVASLFVIYYYQSLQRTDVAVVDTLGRNRVLSQEIGFYAERIVRGGDDAAREDLAEAVNLYGTSFYALKNEGAAPGVAGGGVLALVGDVVRPLIFQAEALWGAYREQALVIAREPAFVDGGTNPRVASALNFIEENESEMLRVNDEMVEAYVRWSGVKQNNFALLMFLVTILILIVIGIMSFIVRRYIFIPIRNLKRGVDKFGGGDLKHRVGVGGEDEIGQLAESFNSMASEILDSYTRLEEKVRIRTWELEEERDKLQKILDNLPVGVAIIRPPNGVIDVMNRKGMEVSGRGWSFGKGKDLYAEFYEVVREDGSEYPPEELPVTITLKTKKSSSKRDVFVRNSDGSRVALSMTSVPLFDGGGEMNLVVAVFEDITGEKEVDKMKTEFVSVVSHQLRTPLTAIRLFVEMLSDKEVGSLSKKQKEYVGNVHHSTLRMIKLVNDLLNVSRLETGRLRVDPEPTDLEGFIQGVIDDCAFLAEKKECRIVFRGPDEKLDKVQIDPSLMRQVIQNLITNAICYSSPDWCEVVVTLEQKSKKAGGRGEVLISVADKGIGVSAKDKPRIFEKFFRSDGARRLASEGSGLGLYVARTIMEASGGGIYFESAGKGKGAKFCVMIPEGGMREKEGERELAV